MIVQAMPYPAASGPPPSPYGSHSWWRLYIDQGDTGDANTDIASLIMRTTSGGAQAATGGTAFAGGAGAASTFTNPDDPFTGANIYRRNTDTGWFIGYHFASATAIVEMSLNGAGLRGRCVISARLQYSDDSTNGTDGTWTDAFSIYDPVWALNTAQAWPQDLTGASGFKAYRFTWTATPTANRTQIAEMEMLASSVDKATSTKVRTTSIAPEASVCDDNAGTDATSVTVSAGSIMFSMVTPILIDQYSLQASAGAVGGARCPRDFTVDGTNDGVTFSNLDTRAGETFSNGQKKTYTLPIS